MSAGKERRKSESNTEVRSKYGKSEERHQRDGSAVRAMLRRVEERKNGKERSKTVVKRSLALAVEPQN